VKPVQLNADLADGLINVTLPAASVVQLKIVLG